MIVTDDIITSSTARFEDRPTAGMQAPVWDRCVVMS
jgi:hypothetical protein